MGRKNRRSRKKISENGHIHNQLSANTATQTVRFYEAKVISANTNSYQPIQLWLTANGVTTKGNTLGDVTEALPRPATHQFQMYSQYRINRITLRFVPSCFEQSIEFPNYQVSVLDGYHATKPYADLISEFSDLKSFHPVKFRNGMVHTFDVNQVVNQRQPVRLLNTQGDISSRELYDNPAGIGFQINPPRLNSDSTKFGGQLGVLRIEVDVVFRQFIENPVPPPKVAQQPALKAESLQPQQLDLQERLKQAELLLAKYGQE